MTIQSTAADRQAVEDWNRDNPIGTAVRYWTGIRQGAGQIGETRAAAHLLGGHTPVVWVTGEASCIALTHVEPLAGTFFMPTLLRLIGDLESYEAVHFNSGQQFANRAAAIRWGIDEWGHDDFRIATVVDGRLAAIGWGMDDFDPVEEDLPTIAEQLRMRVAE